MLFVIADTIQNIVKCKERESLQETFMACGSCEQLANFLDRIAVSLKQNLVSIDVASNFVACLSHRFSVLIRPVLMNGEKKSKLNTHKKFNNFMYQDIC